MKQMRHFDYQEKENIHNQFLNYLKNTAFRKHHSIKSLLLKQSKMSNLFDIKDCPIGPAIQKISCYFKIRDVFTANKTTSL